MSEEFHSQPGWKQSCGNVFSYVSTEGKRRGEWEGRGGCRSALMMVLQWILSLHHFFSHSSSALLLFSFILLFPLYRLCLWFPCIPYWMSSPFSRRWSIESAFGNLFSHRVSTAAAWEGFGKVKMYLKHSFNNIFLEHEAKVLTKWKPLVILTPIAEIVL